MSKRNPMDMFNGLARRSGKADVDRIIVAIPKDLHKCIGEIIYHEGMTLKQYVKAAAEELDESMDDAENAGKNRYEVVKRHDLNYSGDELVHASVILPSNIARMLKDAAHYGEEFGVTSFRSMMVDVLYSYLDHYQERYGDIIEKFKGIPDSD